MVRYSSLEIMNTEDLPMKSVRGTEVNNNRGMRGPLVVLSPRAAEPNNSSIRMNSDVNNTNNKIVKQHNLFGEVTSQISGKKSLKPSNKSVQSDISQSKLTSFFKVTPHNNSKTITQGSSDAVNPTIKTLSIHKKPCITITDNFAKGYRNDLARPKAIVKDFSNHQQHSKNEIIIGYRKQVLPVKKNGTLNTALWKGIDLSCFSFSNLDHVSNKFSKIRFPVALLLLLLYLLLLVQEYNVIFCPF